MIIDTFIFNKDFVALEIRLNELKEVVDYFIISEASFTHSGVPKPLHLAENTDALRGFEDKVIVLSDKKKYFTSNPRVREMIQRQNISREIKSMNLKQTDLIFHSDCDEIPRAATLKTLVDTECDALLELANYSNYINMQNGQWARGRAISFSKFNSIQHMRRDIFLNSAMLQRRFNLPFLKLPDFWSTKRFFPTFLPQFVKYPNLKVYRDAGWHFNNLIPVHQIIEKIESSCHTELNSEEIKASAINNYLTGREIYTGQILTKVNVDNTFPKYVLENPDKFRTFVFND